MNQLPRTALVPAALLAGVCPLVANTIHEDAATDGARIVSEAGAAVTASARISIALFLVGFAALLVVIGVLVAALARRTPELAAVVGVAGAAAVAIKLSEAQTGFAMREQADVLEPATAALLVGIDDAGVVVYGFLLSIALGAAGVGLLRSRLVPAWLGWWAAVAGGLGVLAAGAGLVSPPNYAPIPFLLLLVWLVALGLTVARRPLVESSAIRVPLATQ